MGWGVSGEIAAIVFLLAIGSTLPLHMTRDSRRRAGRIALGGCLAMLASALGFWINVALLSANIDWTVTAAAFFFFASGLVGIWTSTRIAALPVQHPALGLWLIGAGGAVAAAGSLAPWQRDPPTPSALGLSSGWGRTELLLGLIAIGIAVCLRVSRLPDAHRLVTLAFATGFLLLGTYVAFVWHLASLLEPTHSYESGYGAALSVLSSTLIIGGAIALRRGENPNLLREAAGTVGRTASVG